MQQIRKKRDKAIATLRELASSMLIGSVSETYRTCGTASCRCHSTGPKHGPHLYVNYRGDHGKTTGYYVRKAEQPTVLAGLDAWKQFHELARTVALLNKQLMDAARPQRTTRQKRTPKSRA